MKLRTDKQGKPLIVLEAGDVSCLEKAAAILSGASAHVGEFPVCHLSTIAGDIRRVLAGEAHGVALPTKRAAKKEPGAVSDAPDGTEPPTDSVPFAVPGHCDKCGEPLVGSELRRGRKTCFECQPLSEQSA